VFTLSLTFQYKKPNNQSGIWLNTPFCNSIQKIIKKILEVDYPRGRAKGYYANLISAKSLKTEFSLFHPSVSQRD
jgi:hypothetical protein